MEDIISRLCIKNIPVVKQIRYHLTDSLRHTAHLGCSFHDRTDTQIVILDHQLHIFLQITSDQTVTVANLPVFCTVLHIERFKILNTREILLIH